jgi:hypothetical protein
MSNNVMASFPAGFEAQCVLAPRELGLSSLLSIGKKGQRWNWVGL